LRSTAAHEADTSSCDSHPSMSLRRSQSDWLQGSTSKKVNHDPEANLPKPGEQCSFGKGVKILMPRGDKASRLIAIPAFRRDLCVRRPTSRTRFERANLLFFSFFISNLLSFFTHVKLLLSPYQKCALSAVSSNSSASSKSRTDALVRSKRRSRCPLRSTRTARAPPDPW